MTTEHFLPGAQVPREETIPELASEDTLAAIKSLLEEPPRAGRPVTYRADIQVAGGGSGNIVELGQVAPGNRGRIEVKRVVFHKPTVQTTLIIRKQSTRDSGGTSTNATAVRMGDSGSSVAQVKLYTAAPTAGTLIGRVYQGVIGTGDVLTEDWGQDGDQPLTLASNESLALNVSNAVTIYGYIEWTEEG